MNNEQRSRAAECSAAQIEAARVRFEQYVKRLEPGMRNKAPNLKRDEAYAVIAFSLFLACEELQAERDEARIEFEQLRAEQRAVEPMPANQAKKEMPQFVGFTQTALDRHAGRIAAVAAASMADERAAFERHMAEVEKVVVGSTDPYPAGLERTYWRIWQAAWEARAPAAPAAEGKTTGLYAGPCHCSTPMASCAYASCAYQDGAPVCRQHVAQSASPAADGVRWNLVNPQGEVVAVETTCVKAWARVSGYKPTVEGLLGYEEQGWRVLPVAPQPAQADAQRKALQRAIDHAVMSDREDEEEALRALLAALEGGAA
ncbi:hypothetical protein KTF37_23130 [Burkholderia multivorans]|uniref:hypothetical protein n=1 Tax=Burkholderia multivorans TaxID=87883 RepID=UPI001C230F62|nr:hypothetical protein [Burkholderia multivorans]MBU9679740.1 hypothetical protein [Burkholderia multivorans]